jgi:hypothetical protein
MKISQLDFEAKLIKMCGRNKLMQLPKHYDDRLVILGSIIIRLDPKKQFSERSINEIITNWLRRMANKKSYLDHVTLRCYLVDFGLLERDPAGHRYQVSKSTLARLFDSSVMSANPYAIVKKYRSRRNENILN